MINFPYLIPLFTLGIFLINNSLMLLNLISFINDADVTDNE